MKRIVFLLSLVFFGSVFFANSQDLIKKYELIIDTADLIQHVRILASDSFEGRKTGEAGQKKAAAYIQATFEKLDCSPVPAKSYFQTFELLQKQKSGTLIIDQTVLNYPADFGFNGLYQTFAFNFTLPIYLQAKDLFNSSRDFSADYLCVEIENYKSIDFDKIDQIRCKGICFIVSNYDSRYFTDYTNDNLVLPQTVIKTPYLFINKSKLPSKLLRKITSTSKLAFDFSAKLNTKPSYIFTENVLAFVEGSDSILKNEVIVLSAHYDHIGRAGNKIFNGADDNATGTAALLELAQTFQVAKDQGNNPKRSYLFVALTGEEMGLLGSAYYVSNPWIPLSKTITDLNIDMIGRTTKPSEKDTFAVYLIGSNRLSDDLHQWSEKANTACCQLNLDYTYNDVNDPLRLYYRSDHYNFAKNGIPSIFYFGGFHEDYHRETDEIETINFEKLRAVTSLVFHTAWMLGNADQRPMVNH